jgi:hypothetical protein
MNKTARILAATALVGVTWGLLAGCSQGNTVTGCTAALVAESGQANPAQGTVNAACTGLTPAQVQQAVGAALPKVLANAFATAGK